MRAERSYSSLIAMMASCAGLALVLAMAPVASAQDAGTPPAAKAQAKTKSTGDADLRKRVEQLEEQLVDMQVVIGTLESLARSGGAAPPVSRAPTSVPLSGNDSARIDTLETQIRALSSQIEQLSGGARQSGAVGAPPRGAEWEAPTATTSRFGSTTVNAANGDPIGGLIEDTGNIAGAPLPPVTERVSPSAPGFAAPAPAPAAGAQPGSTVAAIDPAAAGGNPKQDYERAYGYLLQQNYGAAQTGFTDFLKTYPRDSLVPNALYWLGETHYVQRNFSDAAEAFDLVTQAYGNSTKAPDAMLKRGMALAQVGKKPEACGLFTQLPGKYPSAPAHVKSKADGERQRLACP